VKAPRAEEASYCLCKPFTGDIIARYEAKALKRWCPAKIPLCSIYRYAPYETFCLSIKKKATRELCGCNH